MKTTFISVLSSKGGVGKTTTCINLAAALHTFGRDVVVVDGNYTKPNVGLQLGITDVKKTLHDSLKGKEDVLGVVYSHPSGVRIVPGSIIYEEIMGDHHRKFSEILDPLRGKTETVFIDSGPGVSAETKEILAVSDATILVTTPDLSSVTDTLRTKRLCKEFGVEVLGVVLTHASKQPHSLRVSEVELIFDSPVIGVIPEDENIKFASASKYPVVYVNPRATSSIAYKKLAANMVGEEYSPEEETEQSTFQYIMKRLGF